MRTTARLSLWLGFLLVGLASVRAQDPAADPPPTPSGGDPFTRFVLPDDWQATFWAGPGVKELLTLDAKALAALVPAQAGLRYCKCPACDAPETDDPLAWSLAKPDVITCRKCGVSVPNDAFPAKVPPAPGKPPAVPKESIEVLPRLVHHYPFHTVDPIKQDYPDERLYLSARRDYEARTFFAKAALYAAVRYNQSGKGVNNAPLARLASVLILRFARVYPTYATHLDQPGLPKILQTANLTPPYRRGYQTAKWDWSGCLDVPLNLVIAYALIRDDPALIDAGRALDDPNPARTIERELFRASARFTLRQPDEESEASLYAVRGVLAVGRLLNDRALMLEAGRRLDRFAERGFYHDGLWRQGNTGAHRRVLSLLDGWIERLLPGNEPIALVALAQRASAAVLTDSKLAEIQQVVWPAPVRPLDPSGPALLGGAGLARLSIGQGADALDLELRGFGDLDSSRHQRLALRLAVGGRTVLNDLDDHPPLPDGWDRASASHNTVLVDGLNQREAVELARIPAPGADVLFYAADPDFQIATLDDRHAYAHSATRYRQTVAASAGAKGRYAVSVFEVQGGLQHDWIAHAPVGSASRWRTNLAMTPGPASLLPATIPYLPTARAEDGRWFVQSLGVFGSLSQGRAERPVQADLLGLEPSGVRLHLMGDMPLRVFSGTTPNPDAPPDSDTPGRAALTLRRASPDGSTLKTAFITVYEPIGAAPPLKRVGRIDSPAETVVLLVETADGLEHLVLNLHPGKVQTVRLVDGNPVRTDGLAVRVRDAGLTLAGGTFAEFGELRATQPRTSGTILTVGREAGPGSRGWFETDVELVDSAALAGRALLIQHGDGAIHGWTIARAENLDRGRCRFFVREEPGFTLDPATGAAHYYQFPGSRAPKPHKFRVARITRSR